MGNGHNRQRRGDLVRGSDDASVSVRASPIQGMGLFANRQFRAGEVIRSSNVVREVTSDAPLRPDRGEREDHCSYPDGRVLLIGFPDRHVNHSCEPNAYQERAAASTRDGHRSVALRDIEPGEEITYDYNIDTVEGSSWPCHCGSERCRGTTIGDFFLLPRAIQQRYRPLLSDWFSERYADALSQLDRQLDVDPRQAWSAAEQTPLERDLQRVLTQFVERLRESFGEELVGAYLHGSAAQDAFDAHSDIDFLVVLRDLPLPELIESTHRSVCDVDSRWARCLEGSYATVDQLNDLGCSETWPYFDNGCLDLEMSRHDNSLVVRSVLRDRSISLVGPDPAAFIPPIDSTALRDEAKVAGLIRADAIRDGSYRIDNRWAQPFVVLTFCRILQTVQTGDVDSKAGAARWARDALDGKWHGLIARAWRARPNPSEQVRSGADEHDVAATREFVEAAVAMLVRAP